MIPDVVRVRIGRACLAGLALWGLLFASRFWDQKLLLGDEGAVTVSAGKGTGRIQPCVFMNPIKKSQQGRPRRPRGASRESLGGNKV